MKNNPVVRGLRAANDWIFGYGSPVTFGVFRILMASILFANFCMIAIDFDAWFSERGYVPWHVASEWMGPTWRVNLLAGVTDTRIVAAFYALVTVSAFLTAIGLWTRPASIILCIGTITLHHRNPIILHGGDTLMRACAFYLAIGPSGASCSVDRLIRLWKGKETGPPRDVSLWPQRMIQFQMAVIYFTTVWSKWFGTAWRDGTAAWYPANLREFDRFPVPEFLHRQPFLALETYSTLLVELALATLVFCKPLRKWVLLSGLALHGFIEYSMNIPLFAFAMCSLYISHYMGDEIVGWAKRMGERLKRFAVRVATPAGQVLATGPGRALEAADAFDLVTYTQGDASDWVAEKQASGSKLGACWASWSRSLGGWILAPFWLAMLKRALVPTRAATTEPVEEPESVRT
ncbi:MAG TPA: HTTM domain-containing protein [Fimbriimonadaceae bacterium]|nr:HTTM domain-containing protein [Fimbriimonadaceae bacterium]